MKATMINKTHIEGYVYEHDLKSKVTGENSKAPGTPFISGNLKVATDNALTNVVEVHFTYVTPTTGKGAENATYTSLKGIIDGTYGAVTVVGVEKAAKVRIDSAFGLNDFYSERNGQTELVSAKRNEGGFVHIVKDLDEDEKKRNTFETDMVITSVKRVDANEERNTPEHVVVKGAIFDFRESLLPFDFIATNPNAMNYFEGLEATSKDPVFTKVWGRQMSSVVVRTIVEESAFGEDSIREIKSNRKDLIITGAAKAPYVWDDGSSITVEEMNKAISDRATYLASVKQRQDEYNNSRNNAIASVPATPAAPANSGFDF